MDSYIAGTGITPGGFMYYQDIAAIAPFDVLREIQYPNSAFQLGLNFSAGDADLDKVATGGYDAQIDLLAAQLRTTDRPVFLRIGYEFDGIHNHYTPEKYIAAYRHVVSRLRWDGVTNVAFVWHSYANQTYGGHPISAWYPGDRYVDWMAVSIFWQAYNGGAEMSYANTVADFADAQNKPLMVAESTPAGSFTPTANADSLWSGWYQPVIDFVNARGVKAWSYINDNWEDIPMWQGQGWGDARIEANAALKSRWTSEVGQTKYLKGSPGLFCASLGYPSTAPYDVTDELDGVNNMLTHSGNLVIDRYDPTLFEGDPARLKRNAAQSGNSATWRTPNVSTVSAVGYVYTNDAYADLSFASSPDGVVYTTLTPSANSTPAGLWDRVEYSMPVPPGTAYVRVTFPNNTQQPYTPQLGQMVFRTEP